LSDAAWLARATQKGAEHWLDNASGCIRSVDLDGYAQPLLLSEDTPTTSYVASLASAWVRYPAEEAQHQLPPAFRHVARAVTAPASVLLRAGGLHRAAVLGNWLVSTNLYPQTSAKAWRAARDAALALSADRPLAVRSVCAGVNPQLPQMLLEDGWLLVPARQVYLCDPSDPEVWKRNNVRNDKRLLGKSDVEVVGPKEISDRDLPRLRHLFRSVFMDKHSTLNPDFSNAYFTACHQTHLLEFYALRHEGTLVGVMGLMERHGWVTTPLLGYDTTKPQSLALYRRLMLLMLTESARRQARLHYSSGAGAFKRARGGEPALEYTALYVRHLRRHQRAAVHTFAALNQRFGAPLLQRYG